VQWALVSRQQLQGSTRKSCTGLSSRQELNSGMHGSESESGSQAGQGARSLQKPAMDKESETLVLGLGLGLGLVVRVRVRD